MCVLLAARPGLKVNRRLQDVLAKPRLPHALFGVYERQPSAARANRKRGDACVIADEAAADFIALLHHVRRRVAI